MTSLVSNEWVAITGSAGYIGSVLAKHCKRLGYNVLGCDIRYTSTTTPSQKYIDYFVSGGCQDPMFAVMCKHHNISKIFHLGAFASVPLSEQQPFTFYHNNFGNTAKMLHHLIDNRWHERPDSVIVFSSTSSVFKETTDVLTEQSDRGSPNAYGRSKHLAEHLFDELLNYYNVPSVIFRYFCVAGAYQDVGQPLHYPHIIARIMEAAYSNKPLTLYGCDWPTKDGSAIRDFISVNDICRAHFHAAEYATSVSPKVHDFNMGTKYGITMLDLIHRAEDVIGINVPYNVSDRRSGDPAILVCNPDKFINETNFTYQDSLDDMILSAWDWYVYKKEETNGI